MGTRRRKIAVIFAIQTLEFRTLCVSLTRFGVNKYNPEVGQSRTTVCGSSPLISVPGKCRLISQSKERDGQGVRVALLCAEKGNIHLCEFDAFLFVNVLELEVSCAGTLKEMKATAELDSFRTFLHSYQVVLTLVQSSLVIRSTYKLY